MMRMLAASLALFAVTLAAQPVRVEGRVVTRSGQPVEGARVVWETKPPVETKTDAQGAFTMEAPAAADQHGIAVTKTGFIPTGLSRVVDTPVIIRLSPSVSITGRVFDTDGNPVPRAQVTLLRQPSYERGSRPLSIARPPVETDKDGVYTFPNLEPGRYYIRVEAKAPAVTTYYPGTLDAAAAAAVDIETGGARSGVDIRQLVAPVFRVRGKAVDESGAPVANASLHISQEPLMENLHILFRRAVLSASDGSFEFGGVLPGPYLIWAEPEGPESPYMGRMSVAVSRDDVDDARLVVNQGFSLSGLASMDDGSAIPPAPQLRVGDKTIEAAIVFLFDVERRTALSPDKSPVAPDGTFRIDRIPPGKYYLHMLALREGVYIKSLHLGSQDITQSSIDLTHGSLNNVRIVFGTDAGSVYATVRDRNGKPMAGVWVALWPEKPAPGARDASISETNENGVASFQHLGPRKYRLAAFADADPLFVRSLDFLEYFQSRAQTIEVGQNGVVERTLEPIDRADATAAIRNLP